MTLVAAALDKQATRDFAPIWEVNSSIHAFASLEDVPLGYWPMIIQGDIGFQGAAGIRLDKAGNLRPNHVRRRVVVDRQP